MKAAARQSGTLERQATQAMAAALASQLGVSHSAAQRAMNQVNALGDRNGVDPASPAFAAIAPARREPGPAGRRAGRGQASGRAQRGRQLRGADVREGPRIMDHVRVLVVDDDAAVRQSLSTALGRDGYEVLAADSGGAALAHMAATSVDAIVLDVAMREPNGLEVCRRLRSRGDRTPILMLTARDLVDDRVAGLDAGADDYLAKPFALAELRARLRALLRRNAASAEQLSYGDLVLDLAAARVTRGGREVPVTRTEYLLLELFLRNPGRVLSHSQIFQAVWGYDFGLRSHNLWVYMSYLRAKLEAAGEPRILHTVRGLGYVLRDAP